MVVLNPNAADAADRLDAERAAGQVRGPLHGIPVVVKDNYDTGDMPTSAGAIALATSVPPDDSTQVRRLREAGAIVLGKTNMHELARGITTVSSLTGQTRNPYDPTRNPGGSSGGTGAAVAASSAPSAWEATPAGRFASRPPTTPWWGCGGRGGSRAATASCPSRPPRTSAAPWRARWRTSRSRSTPPSGSTPPTR